MALINYTGTNTDINLSNIKITGNRNSSTGTAYSTNTFTTNPGQKTTNIIEGDYICFDSCSFELNGELTINNSSHVTINNCSVVEIVGVNKDAAATLVEEFLIEYGFDDAAVTFILNRDDFIKKLTTG